VGRKGATRPAFRDPTPEHGEGGPQAVPWWQTGWAKRLGRGAVAHGFLIAFGVLFFVPVFWLLSSSLKTDRAIFASPPQWIPTTWVWRNFIEVFRQVPFLRYAANTALIAGCVVLGTLISCTLVAYAFARLNWKGREAVFMSVLATMMLPFQVTMIPLYLIFHKIHWVGTFWPLIVPAFFGNPFFIFLLRQFFKTIPSELSDAARTDGASDLKIFWHVILPLAKPALATTALLSFIWTYTDYLGPLLYLTNPSTYTLSLGLADFQGMQQSEWNLLMAASVWTLLPAVVLYFSAQKTFIAGVQTTGMKG
jgi:multiple sugar transport system permease protein